MGGGFGYTIGADHGAMEATVAQLNTQATSMETAADELMTFIKTLRVFWVGSAADAFDALMTNMKNDFDQSNLDLKSLASDVDDFNLNLLNMDRQQATNFGA